MNETEDVPSVVSIPYTKKKVRIKGMKPGTIKALTRLWIERDASIPKDSSDTLKSLSIEPYFAIKEACLIVLNSWWKIKILYPLMWRWWIVRGFTEEQMTPIISEGKKKLPLTSHWTNMALTVDMRADMMKMTMKEASRYQVELLSAASQLSSRTTPNTDGQGTSSSD